MIEAELKNETSSPETVDFEKIEDSSNENIETKPSNNHSVTVGSNLELLGEPMDSKKTDVEMVEVDDAVKEPTPKMDKTEDQNLENVDCGQTLTEVLEPKEEVLELAEGNLK